MLFTLLPSRARNSIQNKVPSARDPLQRAVELRAPVRHTNFWLRRVETKKEKRDEEAKHKKQKNMFPAVLGSRLRLRMRMPDPTALFFPPFYSCKTQLRSRRRSYVPPSA